MSSGCAPTARIERIPVSDRLSMRLPGKRRVDRGRLLRYERRDGQRRCAAVVRIPQHPWALSTMEHVLQLGAILEGVRGAPESAVPVGQQSPLRYQAVEGVRHHVLAV